jgi:hypothetical protein
LAFFEPALTTIEQAQALLIERALPVTLDVTSDSMLPTLPAGSSVRVEPSARTPRRGDLLVFRQADYLVVHRFLGTARTADGARCLRARGDAARPLDPPVAPEHVLGVVVAVRRDGEWRSLRGAPARAYAAALAWHGLVWAWLRSRGLGAVAEAADRGLLSTADRLLFRAAHRRVAPPAG